LWWSAPGDGSLLRCKPVAAMAERAPDEGERGQESVLDQFLRRLDQTDQEGAASPSTSGTTTMADSSLPSTANPWSFMPTLNLDPQTAALLYRSSAPSPYLPANPLADFPWLLEEFDQQQRSLTGDPDAHDSAQRLYSSYTTPQEALPGASPSSSQGGGPAPASRRDSSSSSVPGHGSKLDAEPVPRFGEPGASSTSPVASKQPNYRPPSSPLLSEATAAGVGAGSVTTSAGTSNTSLSSESTSNAGDEDESEVKEEPAGPPEGATRTGKRKKPEENTGAAGDHQPPESKIKSDQPK
jgi:hypothetical protein